MSHPYDASTKYLVERRIADWLPLCGLTTTAELSVINADMSTVTAMADRVFQVHEVPPWLLHLELQSGRDLNLLVNLPSFSVLLNRQHHLLVRTVLVLLRKSADAPQLTGVIERGFSGELPYLTFRYHIVRVWQLPPTVFLNGGLGILPLAPLSAVAETELPAVIERMDLRLRSEATPEEAKNLWTAADVLMGLRYPPEVVAQLLQGVHGMKDSLTYQAIVEEGRLEGRLKGREEGMEEGRRDGIICTRMDDVLRLGRRRFGTPNKELEQQLREIHDADRLARIIDALLDASSWEELLATS